MSLIRLGSIMRLDPRDVSDNAIAVLATRLRTPPSGFVVPCCICGTERNHPTLIDPGQIVYDRFTCQTVNETCSAVRTRPAVRGYSLVPGSLVLAFCDVEDGRFWPAIVEDSPDNFSRHIATIHIEGHVLPMTAYYVTFIRIEPWLGGWIGADSLLPFSDRLRCGVRSTAENVEFQEAMHCCEVALKLSLKERLLLHSFVAHTARKPSFFSTPRWPDPITRINVLYSDHLLHSASCPSTADTNYSLDPFLHSGSTERDVAFQPFNSRRGIQLTDPRP